jgi:hypothetical protein
VYDKKVRAVSRRINNRYGLEYLCIPHAQTLLVVWLLICLALIAHVADVPCDV